MTCLSVQKPLEIPSKLKLTAACLTETKTATRFTAGFGAETGAVIRSACNTLLVNN